ncbi:MAG: hypothetical protein AAGA48_01570 [Myxococcota bacterium]
MSDEPTGPDAVQIIEGTMEVRDSGGGLLGWAHYSRNGHEYWCLHHGVKLHGPGSTPASRVFKHIDASANHADYAAFKAWCAKPAQLQQLANGKSVVKVDYYDLLVEHLDFGTTHNV